MPLLQSTSRLSSSLTSTLRSIVRKRHRPYVTLAAVCPPSFSQHQQHQHQLYKCQSTTNTIHSPSLLFGSTVSMQQQSRRCFSSERIESAISSETTPPPNGKIELDFFGEPVTFLGCQPEDKVSNAMAATDAFVLAVVSKGRTCWWLAGDEAGIDIQSAHGVAVTWAEALRFATFWNQDDYRYSTEDDDDKRSVIKSAPMLAVVAVAPLLAQCGLSYTKHLDSLLKHTKPMAPGLPSVQMLDLARTAIERIDEPFLNIRERMHLQVLKHLLEDHHKLALVKVMEILRRCPGDAFALSLAMDLAHTLGDKDAAMQAAGTIISYWHERRGGLVRPAIPGHALALSYISLGFALGGQLEIAERMMESAMNSGSKVCGAVGTWAKAHIYDAGGRIAEGISACSHTDGIDMYEGAGLLFFDCRMGGYGCRFSLDREERGRGKSAALRLYARHFERVLEYSGFASRQPWYVPVYKSPIAWSDPQQLTEGDKIYQDDDMDESVSLLSRLLGGKRKNQKAREEHFDLVIQQSQLPSKTLENWDPTAEDVLTWLPPTPTLLADATLALFRLTLNGTVSVKDARWDDIRNAWEAQLDIHRKYSDRPMDFCPLVSLAASIVHPPSEVGADRIGSGALARGLHRMGELIKLGSPKAESGKKEEEEEEGDEDGTFRFEVREIIADTDPDLWYPKTDGAENEWRKVVVDLVSALDGNDPDDDGSNPAQSNYDVDRYRYSGWTFDTRPVLEHAIVYSACKAGDIDSLSIARSICSQGVTARPSSPEEWWRYSIVLGLLGDQVASENAWQTSVNVGGGQDARK